MKVRIALATLAGAAMLAMAGVSAMAPGASASTTPTTVSHVSYARDCAPWQLSATLTRGYQAPWNYRELILTLTNTSRWACSVSGYPSLQLLNSRSWPLPTTTVRVMAASPSRSGVVLFPGQSATANITFTVYRPFSPGWRYTGPPMYTPSAAYLVVTLPTVYQGYQSHAQHFVLKIPGGPVRIVQNRLYETPLMGHFPLPIW